MHMTSSSAMLMGSKLHLQYLTSHHVGLNSKYRWTGKMMGIKMDFTVEVTKWVRGLEKVWETIDDAKMIIYSWYQMQLLISKEEKQMQNYLSPIKDLKTFLQSLYPSFLQTGIVTGV